MDAIMGRHSIPRAMCQGNDRLIPLLGQGGVDATSIECREASYEGADGVVRSATDDRSLNQPPRLGP